VASGKWRSKELRRRRGRAKVRRSGSGVFVSIRKCLLLWCEGLAAIFECEVVSIRFFFASEVRDERAGRQGIAEARGGSSTEEATHAPSSPVFCICGDEANRACKVPPTLRLLEPPPSECFRELTRISNRVPVIRREVCTLRKLNFPSPNRLQFFARDSGYALFNSTQA
jgi:hypothetical protein